MKPSVYSFCFPVKARGMNIGKKERKQKKIHTCPDVQPALFFGLKEDVHFCQRGHLKQLVVRGNVYVLVYGSAVQVREGLKKKDSFEGKIEEYSRILGRDALKTVVVVRDKGGKEKLR